MPRPSRLDCACGPVRPPGWINADRFPAPGIDVVADLRAGLPLADAALDYAAAIHVLQDLEYRAIPAALGELRRVLRPAGTLRLGAPDLDRAIDAYRRRDHAYFYVGDADARSIGAELVTQIVWYGSVRTPLTFDCLEEWLLAAGFRRAVRCTFRRTATGDPTITELDDRERESLFVEATR
jgi:ubiquinone/menaquinone biosynthesis C-methylase UbiE